ncbi:MAG: hypothetical protein U9N07_04285 [Euryarchaeota archaeon]|nr:hypothetical protein [Euryarchaeota archaeon]
MAKKKRYRGHFCKVCGKILPNEKFSGKGHAAHICKKCARKSKAQQSEEIAITRIYHVLSYHNLSRDNRRMLENYTHSRSERVRSEALTVLAAFTRYPPSGGIECAEEDFLSGEISDDILE